MDSEEFLIIVPSKVKRNTKQKDARFLEQANLKHFSSFVGPNVESHAFGAFFSTPHHGDVHIIDHLSQNARNLSRVSLSQPISDGHTADFSLVAVEHVKKFYRPEQHTTFTVTVGCRRKDLDPETLYKKVVQSVSEAMLGKLSFVKKDPNTDDVLHLTLDLGAKDDFFLGHIVAKSATGAAALSSVEKFAKSHHSLRCVALLVKWSELHVKGSNKSQIVEEMRETLAVKLGRLIRCLVLEHAQFFVVLLHDDAKKEDVERVAQLAAQTPGCKKVVEASVCLARDTQRVVQIATQWLLDWKQEHHLEQKKLCGDDAKKNQRDVLYVRFHVSLRKGCKMESEEVLQEKIKCAFSDDKDGVVFVKSNKCDVDMSVVTTTNVAFFKKRSWPGVGGLPLSPHNSVCCLLSGGFDSPVAAFQMMKRGCKVHLVHFLNTSALLENAVVDKIFRIAQVLGKFQPKLLLYIVPFASLQQAIISSVEAEERMLVYRFFMAKVSSLIAEKHGSSFLVTGDSYGQVASQTPRNLEAIYKTTSTPILAPLISLDKTEIQAIAERIGTARLSELPYGDCCSFFLPVHPKLHLREKNIESVLRSLVSSVPNHEKLCQEAVRSSKIIRFKQKNGEVIDKMLRDFSQKELQNASTAEPVCMFKPKSSIMQEESSVEDATDQIFLDCASTTFCCQEAVDKMVYWLPREANALSSHALGKAAARAIDEARGCIATALGGRPQEVIFTSGGTEANNQAIFGAMNYVTLRKGKVACLDSDHKSILQTVAAACKDFVHIKTDPQGFLNFDHLEQIFKNENIMLLSLCLCNNETGAIQDAERIAQMRNRLAPDCLIHFDACQVFRKSQADPPLNCCDMMTINAHKICGPKGVGALWISDRIRPQMHQFLHGGDNDVIPLRPGTPSVSLICAFAEAVKAKVPSTLVEMGKLLHDGIVQAFPKAILNGPSVDNVLRVPTIFNFQFPGRDSSQMIAELSSKGVYVSSGSACTSGQKLEASHVLKAIGLTDKQAMSSIRFSISRMTQENEIRRALEILSK